MIRFCTSHNDWKASPSQYIQNYSDSILYTFRFLFIFNSYLSFLPHQLNHHFNTKITNARQQIFVTILPWKNSHRPWTRIRIEKISLKKYDFLGSGTCVGTPKIWISKSGLYSQKRYGTLKKIREKYKKNIKIRSLSIT